MPEERRVSRRAWLIGAATLCAGVGAGVRPARAANLVQRFGRPLAAPPQRLFAAGPPAGVLLACLAPERLLGWPTPLPDAAKALLPAAARDKPVLGRLSGRGSTVSLEALLALQPDLIVDAGSVDATYVSTAQRVAEQTGVPYLLADGRLADSAAQLRELGALLGAPARGQALAAFADEALAEAARVRGDGAARPSVYLARGADGLETATAGAINAEIIEAAGGRNVAVTGRAGVARVSMEQVLGWSPDWVLTQDRNFHRLARGDAPWRTLPAVREGRLLLAPELPFGWLDGPPSVNRLLGVKWLAAQLRRGTAPARAALDESVDEALRFHALFYGVTPPREAVQGWLDGRT
ncbi:ABC transporter substrate-binding protein [Piscinibacter sp.]|uniref:ABC transporter substrate-binding protein n=1 Tax=Piscinibacter sp. TaxID=1903157 RepID=UPI0039E42016